MDSYGALVLANPELSERLAAGGRWNEPDRATFYSGEATGYTDLSHCELSAG